MGGGRGYREIGDGSKESTIINTCSVTVSWNIATVITIKEQIVILHTVCVFGTIIMTG